MAASPIPVLTYQGRNMDASPSACGPLRASGDAQGDWEELRRRMAEDGYLFLPGLLVLEGSHRLEALRQGYGRTDVDAYCQDGEAIVAAARREGRELTAQERARLRWHSTGAFSTDAIETRRLLGGRWLTAEYRMGDLLVFGMYLMHASSDNRTDRIRLSADSRYQLASEAADERWVGPDPPAHGIRAKRAIVC
ncbi:MAG: phytanoyl-CoA dioxygenase family protein [Candidatus Latescibacterota bacterium]